MSLEQAKGKDSINIMKFDGLPPKNVDQLTDRKSQTAPPPPRRRSLHELANEDTVPKFQTTINLKGGL
jgi:hypothetical protein